MLRNLNACLVAVLFALPAIAQNIPLLPNGVQSTGPLRNNYTGSVGMQFTLDLPIEVNALGRAYFPGNIGTHTVKLVNAATGVDVPGASVQLTMSATGSTPFQYATLPTPVLLQANTPYFLVSREIYGVDTWQDLQNITPSAGYQFFSIGGGVYTDTDNNYVVVPNTQGGAYVPPNLLYSSPSSNGTTVSISSPTGGQTVSPPYVYQFTATVAGANAQVAGSVLQFQLDGENYYFPQNYTSSATYSIPVDPITIAAGTHSVTAVYTSPGASPATSSPITFTVPPYRGEYVTYPIGTYNLVTSETPGPVRNNFTGFVGMSFTTGNDPLRVRSLGRFVAPGDTQSHLVKLVDASTGVDVPGASATVALNSSIASGQFTYTYLVPTDGVILQTNHAYYLVSQETAGGDPWYDLGPVATSGLAVNGAVYQPSGATYQVVPGAGYSYVPVSFGYTDTLGLVPPIANIVSPAPGSTLSGMATITASAVTYQGINPPPTIVNYQFSLFDGGSPITLASGPSNSITFNTANYPNGFVVIAVAATDSQGQISNNAGSQDYYIQNGGSTTLPGTPFVTYVQPTFLRNNYTGNVGMEFTVGAAPIQVTALGRYCVSGNSQSHNVVIVQSPSAGTSATVNMASCTPGQYVYTPVVPSYTLLANTAYYFFDSEVSGGDTWYDFSPISTTPVAAVNGPVYYNAAGAPVIVASPASSYVPLNFLYTTTTTAPPDNLTTSITGVTTQGVTATASSNSTITSVQIQVDGYSLGPPLTAAPYVQMIPQLNAGTHQLTSIAKDSAGNTATSAPSSYQVDLSNPPGEYQYPPLVNFTLGPLRNNYTGWVGFQFTLSSAPVFPGTSTLPNPPFFMGRTCVAGNTQPHYIQIVSASDQSIVASAWINCGAVEAGTGSQQSYANIVGTLNPGSTYYLVSQETTGADQFADIGPATPNNCCAANGSLTPYYSRFTIDGPVYFDGTKYVLVSLPDYSYAGMYFLGFQSEI